MIAITGANGNIGKHLAQMLASAKTPARLLMRDPARANTLGGRLEIVAADLDRPATLDAALDGVTRLFLVSPGPDNIPAQDEAAIAAARRAGVRHIVLLSSIVVGIDTSKDGGRTHAPGERLLLGAGLDWTILRASEFMTNAYWWLPEIEAQGTISVPSGKGKVGLIAPADIAAVAFEVLTGPGHAGHIYTLTGPETLSVAEAAAQLSLLIGKPVKHNDISDDAYRLGAREAHIPEPVIQVLSEYYSVLKAGQMEILTSAVEQITGRRACTFADWARATIVPAQGQSLPASESAATPPAAQMPDPATPSAGMRVAVGAGGHDKKEQRWWPFGRHR